MRTALLSLALAALTWACEPVTGDRITGANLAQADARFAAVPADLVVGFAPGPGTTRTFNPGHLAQIARTHGISAPDLSPLCFERPSQMLDEPRMRAALERVLPPDTRVAIHDFSRHSVPHGELVFTMAGLGRPSAKDPDSPVVWRGRLKYGARSSVPVWAKVRLARLETWIETTSRLEARKAIAADQVALKTGWRFPLGESTIRNLDEVIGMLPARSLPAGQILLAPLLHKPYVVSSGDSIEVEVMSGPVHIRFAARAATNARNDETVLIVMPESGKRLQARVRGKGKVSIDVDAYRKTPEMAVAAGAADRLNAHRVGQGEETTPAGDAAGSISQ